MSQTNLKRFDGGRRTPQEYHAEFGFPIDAHCSACGNRPSVRAITMAPYDDLRKEGAVPDLSLQEMKARIVMGDPRAELYQKIISTLIPINDNGTPKMYMRCGIAYSCRSCRKNFERALAKAPSYYIVEINEGPDPTNRIVAQV